MLPDEKYKQQYEEWARHDLEYWNGDAYKNHAFGQLKRYNFLALNVEGKVLDVGCGAGTEAIWLLALSKNDIEIVAVDIAKTYLERLCIAKYAEPINAIAEQLPFKDKAFDCVVMSEILEHVPNPELLIEEAKRLAKKKLILTVPLNTPSPGHVRQYNEETFATLLKEHGINANIKILKGKEITFLGVVCTFESIISLSS
jgi:ubiquinone/menaquinone biosynthesis C-methylase UbiE